MDGRQQFSEQTAQEGTFSEGIEGFRSERELARDHVIGRNRRVAELLCYLSLLRGHLPALGAAQVRCEAARYQDFKASDGNEAAHYLPGQIVLALPGQTGHDPAHFVKDARTKEAIGALFSRVQDLPVAFNKADSYVEQYTQPGLKELLARACRKVLAAPSQPGGKVAPVVSEAYGDWVRASLQAYSTAINRKTDIAGLNENPLPPGTAPSALDDGTLEPHMYKPDRADLYERAVRKNKVGETTATVWDYDQQIRIIEYYVRFTTDFELPSSIVRSVGATFKA
jgi:hypothetical protein